MSIATDELERVTNDYIWMENGKPQDIFYNESYAVNYFTKQRKGLFQRPDGGKYIHVPMVYDISVGGWYVRGEAISSDDRELTYVAEYTWKHGYGNATVTRIDMQQNRGDLAQVTLIQTRLDGGMKRNGYDLANAFYADAVGASAKAVTGFLACCNETATTDYGGFAEDDLVSKDGSKKWEGKRTTTAESITFNVVRTLRTSAKVSNGPGGKPDVGFTSETLFNVLQDQALLMQRLTSSKSDSEAARLGFNALWFEGMDIAADDYCPSDGFAAVNSTHYGAAIMKYESNSKGILEREPWGKIPGRAGDKTTKFYFDGNYVCNHRAAQAYHSGLTV